MRLSIVTPCSRVENLSSILYEINSQRSDNTEWVIILDLDHVNPNDLDLAWPEWVRIYEWRKAPGDVLGNSLKNYALEILDDDVWVYVLDDDNQLYPGFIRQVSNFIEDNPDILGITFCQKYTEGIRAADTIYVGGIDQAQFVLHKSIIDIRYEQSYESDGILISDIFSRHSDRFACLPIILSYYNYFSK